MRPRAAAASRAGVATEPRERLRLGFSPLLGFFEIAVPAALV
jgi:hypothetical protein